jgi:DNA-binding NarL/FixJ family response regulator
MQSLFISPSYIQSPRWFEAFPLASILNDERELPLNLSDSLVWVVLGDEFTFSHVAKWVAAGARVIAFTAVEDPRQAKHALEVGANGYLHYLAAVPVLQQVAQVVEVGGLWLGVDLMRQLVFATAKILDPVFLEPVFLNLAQLEPGIIRAAPLNSLSIKSNSQKNLLSLLSAREQDVAKAVVAGKSNKEAAKQLNITERTVKAHLSAAFEKLGVRDRLHLVLVLSRHQ